MSSRSESWSGRDLKKQRLQSPSKNACIVFEVCKDVIHSRGPFPYEYQIYYVDCDPNSSGSGCNGDEFTHTKPTFRFESDYPLALCGLDSTLYMFEGHDMFKRGETGFAAKFEITPKILAQSPDYRYNPEEESDIVRLKPMQYRKYYPAALPTPDGKSILVFSLRIQKKHQHSANTTFELYDIARDSYEPLPPLAPSVTSLFLYSYACIIAYGFVTKSHFVVETDHSERFVLDLSQDIKKWTPLDRRFPTDGNRFTGTNDGFLFTSHFVYDVTLARKAFPMPISLLPPHEEHDFIKYKSCTALLDDHCSNAGGACHTCVVQAEIYPHRAQSAFTRDSDRDKYSRPRHEGDISLLVVDICSTTNIQRYKTEVKKKKKKYYNKRDEKKKQVVLDGDDEGGEGPRLRTTRIKTLKFMIHVDSSAFISMALFSI